MELCTLFSGSSGNACLIRCGDTQLLVDAGVSAKRLVGALRNLDVDPGELSGLLVTQDVYKRQRKGLPGHGRGGGY